MPLVFCRRFLLTPWEECWTAKPKVKAFEKMKFLTEYVGKGIYEGRVHGCTGYTHTKGERGYSLEFTHSVLGASPPIAWAIVSLHPFTLTHLSSCHL